jgi:hypothetical protein
MESFTHRLNQIQERIDAAVRRSGRSPGAVKLMAVSKTRSRLEVEEAYRLGLRLFGENRVQEGAEKFDGMPEDTELHLIGHLQRNKAKAAAAAVTCVQSIDKLETAAALERYCADLDKTMKILLEVNTSGETSKEGVTNHAQLIPLIEAILEMPHLKISGLMTMAPFTDDQTAVRASFSALRKLQEHLVQDFPGTDFSELSMGMSSDFELAIEEGSTLVRVGTSLFGPRN